MANTRSALKCIRINKRNRLQNRFYKSSVRTLIKMFSKRLEIYKVSQNPQDKFQAQILLSTLYSLIDKASKKHIFHKNMAARKKAHLAAKLRMH